MTVSIGSRVIGGGRPAYVIAEIGLNHNGDVEIAKQLIDVAADAGVDAVKFQKRTPEISTPVHMRDTLRETPWGTMTYLDYRYRVEFTREQYVEVSDHALLRGLDWFASPWDVPSVAFLEDLNVVAHKVASACLTDIPLLQALRDTGKPVILSTGMSTIAQIDTALELGAVAVERHITLDRTMWGSDHAASLEPAGLQHLVRDIRIIEQALGDGVKRVLPGEQAPMAKLRRVLT